MFNFFKKKKPVEKPATTNSVNINSITIPTFGWNIIEKNDGEIVWVNPEQSALISIYFFNIPPDLPTIKYVDALRDFHRSVANSGGGIIEVSTFNLKNFPSVKTIFKFPQPEKGMSYLASVTIPFENCSFVIKTQAVEVGTTGMRDSLILSKFFESGEVTFGDDGLKNWFEDPYDPTFKEGTPMNKSEKEEYDIEFPEHPLTKVRSMINQAIEEVVFRDELKDLPLFNK